MANDRSELELLRKRKRLMELEARGGDTPAIVPVSAPMPANLDVILAGEEEVPLETYSADGSREFGRAELGGLSAIQGATLGFGNEFISAVGALYDRVAKGTPLDEGYEQNMAMLNNLLSQYEEAHPGEKLTAEVAGGLTTGITSIPKLLKGKSTPGKLLTGGPGTVQKTIDTATAGAGLGAIAGAGYGEEDRLAGAKEGAIIGGIGGAASVPVVGILQKVINKVVGAFPRESKSLAGRKILESLERDEITAEQALANMKKIGPEATLADAGGENLLALADAVANIPGKARNVGIKFLNSRQDKQFKRVYKEIESKFDASGDFYKTAAELEAARKTLSAPLYKKAEQVPIPYSSELETVLMRPSVQGVWKRAKSMAEEEGRVLTKAGKGLTLKDTPYSAIVSRPLDMRSIDSIKKALDDRIGSLMRSGKNEQARLIIQTKNQMLDIVDRINPTYKAARAQWGGIKEMENALEFGRQFVKGDVEVLQRNIAKMTDAEKQFFRIGAVRQMRQVMADTPDGADVVKRIFGSRGKREKLESLFPNRKAYKEFSDRMDAETTMYRTRAKITGGSPTQPRLAGEADLGAGEVAMDVATGYPMNVARRMSRAIKRPPERIAEQLGPRLLSSDQPANEAFMQSLINKQQGYGQYQELMNAIRGGGTGGYIAARN